MIRYLIVGYTVCLIGFLAWGLAFGWYKKGGGDG